MNVILLVVSGVSLVAAGFMSAIAWRMSREGHRRSEARVATLSAAIYDEAGDEPFAARMFDQPAASSTGRFSVIAIAGVCVVAAMAGIAVIAARGTHGNPPPVTAAPAQVTDAPLELLALEHERDGGQLIVRGLVRNPANAAERDGLTAVVLLVGHDGATISSHRAAVPSAKLPAGATTPFVVTAPGGADVDRFRLSFRTDARVEPHVDRRSS